MHKTFDVTEPVAVHLRADGGDLTLVAEPGCREASVELQGDEDYVAGFAIELHGGELHIQAPDRPTAAVQVSILGVRVGRGPRLTGTITVPAASSLYADVKGADLRLTGTWEQVESRSASGDLRIDQARELAAKSGSGDIVADAVEQNVRAETGSGDITLGAVGGDVLAHAGSGDVTLRDTIKGDANVKTSSGDIAAQSVGGEAMLQTASGDLDVRHIQGAATLRTASGDISVATLGSGVQATSASGDIDLRYIGPGECMVRSVSGDVRVTVPPRIPVWTDVHTVSGDLGNRLVPVGEPEPGEPVIHLRATTTSGDIQLQTARS